MGSINWSMISVFDCSVAGFLTIFLLRGICMGFVRQIAASAALIVSCWLAGAYALQIPPLAARHLPQIEELTVQPAVLFWISAGSFYLLLMLTCKLISMLLATKLLGWTDRMAGGLLGLARGVFAAALLFMPLSAVLPISHPFLKDSLTAPYLAQGAELIRQCIRDLKIREDLRPMPPEAAPKTELPSPPADGTRVMPDAIPDQEAMPPPAPEQEKHGPEQMQAAPAED